MCISWKNKKCFYTIDARCKYEERWQLFIHVNECIWNFGGMKMTGAKTEALFEKSGLCATVFSSKQLGCTLWIDTCITQ